MRPGGHFSAPAGAVFVRAALFALIVIALPAGAWAASPASGPGTTVVPAIKYTAPDPVPTPQPAPAPVSVRVPVPSPVPVPLAVPVPRTVLVPRRVTFAVAGPPSPTSYAPTAPVRHGPSPDPSPVAVTSPVGGTDYPRSDSTPNVGARSRTASIVGSRSTGDNAGSLSVAPGSTVKPDRSPAAGTTTGNSRGSIISIPSSPQGAAAGLSVRQLQAEIAGESWPQPILGTQLSAAAALGPELQSLLARIEKFAQDGAGTKPLVLPSPPGGGSASQRESVLTPAGETSWRAATRAGAEAGGQLPIGDVASSRTWTLVGTDRATTAAASVPQSARATAQLRANAVPTIPSRRRADKARRASPSTSGAVDSLATVGGGPPVPSSGPASASGSSASGGVGVGAAAAALLAVAAIWLLNALLPGRLALDLFPWRSTMFAFRLERPG